MPEPILINSNAGWCWFQGERAVTTRGQLFAGSVASGPDGDERAGNVEVTQVDLATGDTHVTVLAERLQADDHNAPALHVRQDGRLVALYSKHSSDRLARWRVSVRPGDATAWEPEQTLAIPGRDYCYNNVLPLGRPGEPGHALLNFHRGVDRNPNYLISDDDGLTWRYGGKLMAWKPDAADPRFNGTDGARPYVRYAPGPDGSIHFITTEDHPRGYDNSIYHGLIRLVGGVATICTSDGTPLAPLATTADAPVQPTDFTRVFAGSADAVAWTVDLRVDANGHPAAVFSTQRGDGAVRADTHAGGGDLRYHHAHRDGVRWHEQEIAHAGTALYAPEVDYPGLAALDPADPRRVVLSSNADPVTGAPLVSRADGKRHYELYRASAPAWEWKPVTRDSPADQLRPVFAPADASPSPLLWLRGTLTTYRDYELEAVLMTPGGPGR